MLFQALTRLSAVSLLVEAADRLVVGIKHSSSGALLLISSASTAATAGFLYWHLKNRSASAVGVVSTAALLASLGLCVHARSASAAALSIVTFLLFQRGRCIGLTGGIATGKSTVSRALQSCGFIIVDLDVLARRAVERGSRTLTLLRNRFGPGILDASGNLDRRQLRSIISSDPAARRYVNGVTHPAIFWLMLREVAWHQWLCGRRVVIDAPLLFESGMLLRILCAPVIVVAASPDVQLRRLMTRDSAAEADAAALIKAQWSLDRKIALADVVMTNDGSEAELQQKIHEHLIPLL